MLKRKRIIYSLMCAVLLAGCTQNEEADVLPDVTGGVAIAFDCKMSGEAAGTRAANGTTGFISGENGHLYNSGFGIFAQEEGASGFDIMSNQKVEYTFLANDPNSLYDGYWTYQPLKYWPIKYDDVQHKSVPKTLCICAYAPYVERPESLPAGTAGIIEVSEANAPTPNILYARAKRLEDAVDLLWSYMEPKTPKAVNLKMYHALARVGINVSVNAADLTAQGIDKVLIEQIRLVGNIARSGKLELSGYGVEAVDDADPSTLEGKQTGKTPIWNNQDIESDATIVIDHAPTTYNDPSLNRYSYGIIAESVRYIENLPKQWQPAGLTADHPTKTNVLAQNDDQPTYLLLIPQASLSLTAHITMVVYKGDTEERVRKTGEPVVIAAPLEGNKKYTLHLNISFN